jgi:hypothetical protein
VPWPTCLFATGHALPALPLLTARARRGPTCRIAADPDDVHRPLGVLKRSSRCLSPGLLFAVRASSGLCRGRARALIKAVADHLDAITGPLTCDKSVHETSTLPPASSDTHEWPTIRRPVALDARPRCRHPAVKMLPEPHARGRIVFGCKDGVGCGGGAVDLRVTTCGTDAIVRSLGGSPLSWSHRALTALLPSSTRGMAIAARGGSRYSGRGRASYEMTDTRSRTTWPSLARRHRLDLAMLSRDVSYRSSRRLFR